MGQTKNKHEYENIYAEIGVQCPYLLAKHQGVKLATSPADMGQICGIYQMTGRETYKITLNPNTDIETQETTVFLLIKHHNSDQKGVSRKIMKNDLKMLNRIAREAKKINTMIVEIFLRGSIFNRA